MTWSFIRRAAAHATAAQTRCAAEVIRIICAKPASRSLKNLGIDTLDVFCRRHCSMSCRRGAPPPSITHPKSGSRSFGITARQGGDSGARYGDLMPAPDQIQAAAFVMRLLLFLFTVLQHDIGYIDSK